MSVEVSPWAVAARGESSRRHPAVPHLAPSGISGRRETSADAIVLVIDSAIRSEYSEQFSGLEAMFAGKSNTRCRACFVGEEELWNEYSLRDAGARFGAYYDGAARRNAFAKNPAELFDLPAFGAADREVRFFFDADDELGVWCLLVSFASGSGKFRFSKFVSSAYREKRGAMV